ncbi:MAG: hypothetical protein ACRDBG_03855 [Waterburya sp.]
MLKAWLVGVGILFVLAEFSIWLKQFMLPLPIYILAGAFLAIASNYEHGLVALFRQPDPSTAEVLTQTATLVNQAKELASSSTEMATLSEGADEQ